MNKLLPAIILTTGLAANSIGIISFGHDPASKQIFPGLNYHPENMPGNQDEWVAYRARANASQVSSALGELLATHGNILCPEPGKNDTPVVVGDASSPSRVCIDFSGSKVVDSRDAFGVFGELRTKLVVENSPASLTENYSSATPEQCTQLADAIGALVNRVIKQEDLMDLNYSVKSTIDPLVASKCDQETTSEN